MSQPLRIVPLPSHPTSKSNTSTTAAQDSISRGAPSAPGLPDTLRLAHQTQPTGPTATAAAPLTSTHPLEARLSQWQTTQSELQKSILRRTFGIALPLRVAMEQQLVARADAFRPSVLGPASGVHGDILAGRDASIDWEDVYNGQDGLRGIVGVGGDGQGVGWAEEMEVKVGMGKW